MTLFSYTDRNGRTHTVNVPMASVIEAGENRDGTFSIDFAFANTLGVKCRYNNYAAAREAVRSQLGEDYMQLLGAGR